jgi:hypothetical protein
VVVIGASPTGYTLVVIIGPVRLDRSLLEGVRSMLKGFREFIMRGNVVDLAIAVVIGTAFTALVKAFVADILTPVVAAIFGQPNFGDLT